MPFEFPADTKFAAIHLSRCSSSNLPELLGLDNGLSVHTAPVLRLTEMDRNRIGSDYAQAFDRSNVVLVASMQSQTPGVMDAESKDLDTRVNMFFYGILMRGFPNFWPGIETIGSRRGTSEPWANRISIINDFFKHGDMIPFRVSSESLSEDQKVVVGLSEVFAKDPDYQRLRRGVNALIVGWKARSVLDRLHAFVRALDALMKLKQGAGERQFAERVGILATGSRVHDIALEIYRLRSFEEHLSDWPSKLGYIKEPDRPLFVSERSFQAELLAGLTYHALLSDLTLCRALKISNVENFWASGTSVWTSRVDLDAQKVRFNYIANS